MGCHQFPQFSVTQALFELERASSVGQFSLIESSLGPNPLELIGSGSAFLRNVFPGAQGFYFGTLEQCRANMLSGFAISAILLSFAWLPVASADPQNYKSFNMSLYIRSLIGSEVKAVCCTEKTS